MSVGERIEEIEGKNQRGKRERGRESNFVDKVRILMGVGGSYKEDR